MIRHIDPVSPAAGPEQHNDRPRDGSKSRPRHDADTALPEATIVHLSAPALARRPGRPRVPPPDSWAGAMIDLVFDAAMNAGQAIRRDPKQAAAAQANGSPDRALELTAV